MICSSCNSENKEDDLFCLKCGSPLREMETFKEDSTLKEDAKEVSALSITDISSNQMVKTIAFSVLAVVVLIMSFIAASKISSAGLEIMSIESVGGKTLEEAYYQGLGGIYSGYAIIVRTIGIFFASVLVWLGLKR